MTADPDVVIAAQRSGWYRVALSTGESSAVASPEGDRIEMRFNDGAVDSRGRFWAGTLHDDETEPCGSLYRLDPDRSVVLADAGFVCANGIDWSVDDRWMYLVDSRRNVIYRYPFDAETGGLGPREIWIDTAAHSGIPDGLCVDADGIAWCAFWDGGAIRGFGPDGGHLRTIDLPMPRPTSVTFGGPALRTMYVTSASIGLSSRSLARFPASGTTLAATNIAVGRPAHIFGQAAP